jgi:hypothetical protein
MLHAEKVAFLTGGIDATSLEGLEIGAREAPLFRRPAYNITYADYADTETLRASLTGTGTDPSLVVEVDIVTGGGKLSDATTRRFDYIAASHVAEHVPDLLGWLIDLQSLLKPQGLLGLIIPDRRFTFDVMRAESTIAEALEAWILGYQRPSPRQIIDSAWQVVDISPQQGWDKELPSASQLAERDQRLAGLVPWVKQACATGDYLDSHCWVFTPSSFLALARQAATLGLFPFVIERFQPPDPGGYEFLVLLRKAGPDQAGDIAASLARAGAELACHPGEVAFAGVAKEERSFLQKRTKKLWVRCRALVMKGPRQPS